MTLTLLVAGFGPFPGSPINPSAGVAERVGQSRRPAFDGVRRVVHVFPTCYAAVDRELPDLLARERPDVAVLFGVAARSKHVRIEILARNRTTLVFPDASRSKPSEAVIDCGAPALIAARFSPPRLVAAARAASVRANVSRHAGSYLCNYAYWRALAASRHGGAPRLVAFVHLPPTRRAGNIARSDARRPTIAALSRAGEAIALALIAAVRNPLRTGTQQAPSSYFRATNSERIMDWNRIEGNWKQFTGQVKQKWGKLTDDDMTEINGRREELEGKLQQRYGYSKDQIRKEVDTWLNSAS